MELWLLLLLTAETWGHYKVESEDTMKLRITEPYNCFQLKISKIWHSQMDWPMTCRLLNEYLVEWMLACGQHPLHYLCLPLPLLLHWCYEGVTFSSSRHNACPSPCHLSCFAMMNCAKSTHLDAETMNIHDFQYPVHVSLFAFIHNLIYMDWTTAICSYKWEAILMKQFCK